MCHYFSLHLAMCIVVALNSIGADAQGDDDIDIDVGRPMRIDGDSNFRCFLLGPRRVAEAVPIRFSILLMNDDGRSAKAVCDVYIGETLLKKDCEIHLPSNGPVLMQLPLSASDQISRELRAHLPGTPESRNIVRVSVKAVRWK